MRGLRSPSLVFAPLDMWRCQAMLSCMCVKELQCARQSMLTQLECCKERCGTPRSQRAQYRSAASLATEHSSRDNSLHRWSMESRGVPIGTIRSGSGQELIIAQYRGVCAVSMRASSNYEVCGACPASATQPHVSRRSYAAPAEKPAPTPHGIEKEPLLPYDSDENSATGAGLAPFIPPSIQKLINVIMRHGKKEVARGIVFDASHALYNAARDPNPRPELRQRRKEYIPK